MERSNIPALRLAAQGLMPATAPSPADVVRRLGAVQAQDYAASLWAIGVRCGGDVSREDVERAVAAAEIVRTWPMRGTLHFVHARDLRWMTEHFAPRAISHAAARHRQLGIDDAVLSTARRALVAALEGGRQRRRDELYEVLRAAGEDTAEQRGLHVLGRLAMEGLLCVSAHSGRQPTFALVDEWVAPDPTLDREEALRELAWRYMVSHGPATERDLAWWGGLTLRDARAALASNDDRLRHEQLDGASYWFDPATAATAEIGERAVGVVAVPAFDEYIVGYTDRRAVLDPAHKPRVLAGGVFNAALVVDGQVVAAWRRRLLTTSVRVEVDVFGDVPRRRRDEVVAAFERYGRFMGRSVELSGLDA
jgi:Winged helix DNA-binding domain